MARYKPTNYAQGQFISIAFEHQNLPGTFEHALNYIVDNKLKFDRLDAARNNDDGGAPAYDPRVMLKISETVCPCWANPVEAAPATIRHNSHRQ